METKTIMEKQLNEYQVRLLSAQRFDSDLYKYKQEVEDLLNQSELDKKRLCDLCEKNAKLELEMKNVLNQNLNLDEELNYYKQQYTFLSAEMSKQEQNKSQNALNSSQLSQLTQLFENNKLKLSEYEHLNADLVTQIKTRDQELLKLKDLLRQKEANLDECMAKIKVLGEELNNEQETRSRCEKMLEQHKSEIKDLQIKLDECVSETRKLDMSIREAALSSEQKECENQENFKKLIDSHEQLNDSYKKLLVDHEQLQKIYLQMEQDYEELYGEASKKNNIVQILTKELDEIKEENCMKNDALKSLEEKLRVYEAKQFYDQSVNTSESMNNTVERKKVEELYDSKFRELNYEINDLVHQVILLF
jgi:hypothetical protein